MYSVLYVDDEPNLLALGKLFLERSGEFIVDTKESVQEGLAVFGSRHFDVIISDYQMPEKDGIQFLREVRSSYGDVPFILFTGRGREEVVIEAINCGADFYLQKGGDPKSQFAELSHKIKQAVRKKHAEASLRTSERMISDIISFLPDATFAVDREGTVISWNWAMEKMTGVKAGDIIGKSNYEYSVPFFGARRQMLVDMIVKPDEARQQGLYPNVRRDGNVLIAESEDARPKGKTAILWARATPLYDAGGNIIGAIESLRDITEFRRLDRAHQQEKEELRKAGIGTRYTPGLFDKLVGKSANSWLKRGIEYYYKYGNFEEAVQCFDRVIELDPKNWRAWNNRGICLKELGRYEEALQCFDRLIESDDEEVFYNKGETLEKMGEANGDYRLLLEAISYFDRVISMNPRHVYALNYKGVCLKELGRSDEAKIYFDHAQLILRRGENKAKPRPAISHRNTLHHAPPDFNRGIRSEPRIASLETSGVGQERQADIRESGGSPLRNRNGGHPSGQKADSRGDAGEPAFVRPESTRTVHIAIPQSASEGIIVVTDRDEEISYNNRFREIWQIPEDIGTSGRYETVVTCMLDKLEDPERFRAGLRQAKGSDGKGDGTLRLKDGTSYAYESETVSLDGRQGRWWSFREIPDREKDEDAINGPDKKSELLSRITRHDIGNQLAILQGYLAIMKESQPDAAGSEYFMKVESTAERVSGMLRFAKEYEDIGDIAPVWQDFQTLIQTAARQRTIGQVLVKNNIPAGAGIFADPMIIRVFYNLVDNAVRHGGSVTAITFSIEDHDDHRILVCEDDGTGIPADEKEKIFDRNYGKNTGLGLFLSREILSVNGMSITETGTPGNGARFEIRYPRKMSRFPEKNE